MNGCKAGSDLVTGASGLGAALGCTGDELTTDESAAAAGTVRTYFVAADEVE
jgi:hypothetical protein